jgi:hypothetical protein
VRGQEGLYGVAKSTMWIAAAVVLAASAASAQHRPFQLATDAREQAQQQQDQRDRRLDAADDRAIRSICNISCAGRGVRTRTQPVDPFASLPDINIVPSVRLRSIDDPE